MKNDDFNDEFNSVTTRGEGRLTKGRKTCHISRLISIVCVVVYNPIIAVLNYTIWYIYVPHVYIIHAGQHMSQWPSPGPAGDVCQISVGDGEAAAYQCVYILYMSTYIYNVCSFTGYFCSIIIVCILWQCLFSLGEKDEAASAGFSGK